MRTDQYDKLVALQEKLTDTVIEEADPARWPGADQELAALSREDRGDRYWCKRNAAASLSIVMKIHNLLGAIQRISHGAELPDDPKDDDLDLEIRAAEKDAAALLNKISLRRGARTN